VQFPHTPLGDTGLAQAERLGAHLAARRLGVVVTSDYARARMTAERIATRAGVPLIESVHLRERNFGDLRGIPYAELADVDLFGPAYHPPGGECWADFHARVDRAWDELLDLLARTRGDVAAVTHGLVLRSLVERKLDTSNHSIEPDFIAPNTAVTTVEDAPPWRIVEFACVAHLAAGPRDVAPV
jgi:probable phosphoglycerate mutase